MPILYPASVCIVAQGSKTVTLGSFRCDYNPGTFMLARYDVTAFSSSKTPTEQVPLVALAIELDFSLLGRVIAALEPDLTGTESVGEKPALTTHDLDAELIDTLTRLVRISRSDVEWKVLSEGIMSELYLRLALGPSGSLLRERVASEETSSQVAEAIRYIESNFTESVQTDDIADAAGVSVSGLHAKFKAITGQAPMQFVKRLRLNHAKTLLVAGSSVTEAALSSGYNSVSRFSRDFRREYGFPPSQARAT